MARRLNTFVTVDGEWYGPDDDVPDDVAKRIGDHAWDDGDQGDDEPADVGFVDPSAQQSPTPTGAGEAPPRSGRGSGIEAWRAYAERNGIGTDSDMTREDIIAAAEDAGLIDREE